MKLGIVIVLCRSIYDGMSSLAEKVYEELEELNLTYNYKKKTDRDILVYLVCTEVGPLCR
jgi:hypothetical protein